MKIKRLENVGSPLGKGIFLKPSAIHKREDVNTIIVVL